MTEHIQHVRTFNNNGVADQTTRIISNDGDEMEQSPASTLARVIWFIAGVIIALLAIRFVFVLLGANQNNGFVDLIYTLSYPFAVPFFGVFGYSVHYDISRFETSTLVGIVIYALIAWGLARLVTIRHPQ